MAVGGSQQEALYPGFVLLGTRQQGVPVILRELILPDGFDPVLLSFTVRDECQVARNPGPGFPVDYLQPPAHLNIVHTMSSHLGWWPHYNSIDGIRSALRRT
ncbi:unnamed protein product [Schistosoma mattheei]|uniref:Uncharacterized protein n=1 Tax=Schistosoma mattheei TaxID=31246 RepID=A0A3P8IVW8_9TREM|nr:unnamed protein product [Schistosoma mattheei]